MWADSLSAHNNWENIVNKHSGIRDEQKKNNNIVKIEKNAGRIGRSKCAPTHKSHSLALFSLSIRFSHFNFNMGIVHRHRPIPGQSTESVIGNMVRILDLFDIVKFTFFSLRHLSFFLTVCVCRWFPNRSRYSFDPNASECIVVEFTIHVWRAIAATHNFYYCHLVVYSVTHCSRSLSCSQIDRQRKCLTQK